MGVVVEVHAIDQTTREIIKELGGNFHFLWEKDVFVVALPDTVVMIETFENVFCYRILGYRFHIDPIKILCENQESTGKRFECVGKSCSCDSIETVWEL